MSRYPHQRVLERAEQVAAQEAQRISDQCAIYRSRWVEGDSTVGALLIQQVRLHIHWMKTLHKIRCALYRRDPEIHPLLETVYHPVKGVKIA